MKGKKKQSITIDFYTEEKERSKLKISYMIIVQAILIICSTLGIFRILLTALEVPVLFEKLIGFYIFIIIMFFFIFMFCKWTKYTLSLSGILYLYLLIKNFEKVKEGCFSMFNIYIKQYNKYLNMNLIGFPKQYPNEESVILIFLSFLSVLVIGIISYVVIRNRKHLLYFIITIPFIIIALSIGKIPDTLFFALYFISSMGIISASGVKKQKGNWTDKSTYQPVVVLFVILIGILIVSVKFLTKDTYENKMNVGEIKAGWQKSMEETNLSELAVNLMLKNSATGGIGEGRLGRVGSVKFKNHVMFEITMPQLLNNLYIRSYVGSTYNSSGWTPLETEDMEESRSVLEDLREQDFSSTNEAIKFLDVFNEFNLLPRPFIKADITIKDIQSKEKYQKVPYYAAYLPNMDAVEQELTPFENKQSPTLVNRYLGYFFVQTDSSSGSLDEMYHVVLHNYTIAEIQKNALEMLLEKSIEEFDEQDEKFYESMNVSELSKRYHYKHSIRNTVTPLNGDILVNDMVEVLKKYSTFANQEEQYRKIVYQKYLQLPTDSCESLMKEWGSKYYYESLLTKVKGKNYAIYYNTNAKGESQFTLTEYSLENGNIRYNTDTSTAIFDIGEVVTYVKDYLNQNTTYSLEPGNTPKGKDFIEYFLTENKKGYCSYYATAATIMFRSMGIPARYVEGYVVTQNDIKYAKQDGMGTIEEKHEREMVKNKVPMVTAGIRDSNAHAWTEIYLDGYGWMPVDATPGYTIDGMTALPEEITNPQSAKEDGEDLNTQNKPKNEGEFNNQIPEEYDKPENTVTNTESDNNQAKPQANDEKDLPQRVKTENEIFMENVYKVIVLLGSAVGAVIIFMVGIYFRWILLSMRKQNDLKKGDNLVKINIYYKDIRCMLTYYGVKEGNLSNYTGYCQEVEEKIYLQEKGVFTECINIMVKSRFSKNGITREELKKVKKCHDSIRKTMEFRINRLQRWKLKYLNIIYPFVHNDDSATRNIK